MILSRRDFLKLSQKAAATLVVSSAISACSSQEVIDTILTTSTSQDIAFNHGVASGDPLSNRVIIWTRVTPKNLTTQENITISYEISKESNFLNLLRSGDVITNSETDFTVKIDVTDLEANSKYYYRFTSNGIRSTTATMKTLPVGEVDEIKMAICTCANYPNGYFNVYREIANNDELDVVVHLGDYIYEYGMLDSFAEPAYATLRADEIGRRLPADNDTELFSLSDYRKRHALYKKDVDTQALHQRHSVVHIWDDHEVADNYYHDGANNHNENPEVDEGEFELRRQAGMQAFFEWLPIRPFIEGNNETIYRSFDFGDLVSLHMLDTRSIGRDKQLDHFDYISSKGYDGAGLIRDVNDTSRFMLGEEQLSWLEGQIAASNAKWQVLGQQVIMAKMVIPAELILHFGSLEGNFFKTLTELVALQTRKLAGDTTLTEEEENRLEQELPYNLDAWDGYAPDRRRVYTAVKKDSKNLVVLAGDSHNSWGANLRDDSEDDVGVMFATTSITSPGAERFLKLEDNAQTFGIEALLVQLVKDLKYCNIVNRGFMLQTYTKKKVTNEWVYVNNIETRDYKLMPTRKKSMHVYDGDNHMATLIDDAKHVFS